MIEDKPAFVREVIKETVTNQIFDGKPPQTKAAYERLMQHFNDHEEVMRMLSYVVAAEMFDEGKGRSGYNSPRFLERLNKLPDLSWMEE